MRRRGSGLALAAVIGLIGLSLTTGVAAGDSGTANGAPKSLTHHFPLGTQTLSHSKTAASGSATTTHRASSTTPHRGSTATPGRSQTRPHARGQSGHGISSVLLLLAIPIVILAVLLGWLALQKSGRNARSRSTARTPSPGAETNAVEPTPPPLPVRQQGPAPPLPVRPRGK